MKLKKFKASGFRCLKDIEWIDLKDLIIFTGQNDGGKTSALDGLEIFLNPRSRLEDNNFTIIDEDNSCEELIFEGIFELSPAEQKELNWNNSEIYIKNVRQKDNQSKYSFKTQIHPDKRLQRDFDSIPINDLRKIADDYKITVTERRKRDPFVAAIKTWLTTQKLDEGFLELPSHIMDKFPTILLFKSAKALDPEDAINQTLAYSFAEKIKTKRYSGRLSKLQKQIEKEMKNDLHDFETIVKTYCSDVESIGIVPTFDFSKGFKTSKLTLKKWDSAPRNLENEGEGRKRRITLAVYEWRKNLLSEPESPEKNNQVIIAFDEPDTHLDYVYQRKILDMIKRIARAPQNSVIVCTHSLNLIDRIPITDIIHFKKDADQTKIETLKTDDPKVEDMFLYEISDCMGLKNSIMLNERCFLIVEGNTEFHSLPILFKKLHSYSLQAGGIRLINGQGCGGVRSLAKFLNDNRRNVIFLLDTDTQNRPNSVFTPAKLQADGFDINRQVFFVGTKEYEDAFTDDVYERAANSCWAKHDGSAWSRQEFTRLRAADDFCDALFALLRGNTHKYLKKAEVGMDVAKVVNTNEIPNEIISCLNEALRLSA